MHLARGCLLTCSTSMRSSAQYLVSKINLTTFLSSAWFYPYSNLVLIKLLSTKLTHKSHRQACLKKQAKSTRRAGWRAVFPGDEELISVDTLTPAAICW